MSAIAVALLMVGSLAGLQPGSYALAVVVEGPRAVPLLGRLETRTESWSLVELVKDPGSSGATFVATETACSIESDGGLFTARAGPASLAGLAASSWVLRVSPTGEVTADRGTFTLGYRNPSGVKSAAVPTHSDDPRVTDPDKDGLPGAAMTVDVWGRGALRLQVASAWQTALVGRLRGTTVVGTVRATGREEILSGLPLPGRLEPVTPREEHSRFRLAPLPPAATGCAAVDAWRGRAGGDR